MPDDETVLATQRLLLIPGTVELTRAALAEPGVLGKLLDASVPAGWPPEFLDPPAFEYTLARLAEGPEQAGWWLHFVVKPGPEGRTLIGTAGYKGPPSPEGMVEVGYGFVSEYQRRGYATEAVRGLLVKAFALSRVERVIAETLPELAGSIGVLNKCGFRFVGEGSEPGVIRFELAREEYLVAPR